MLALLVLWTLPATLPAQAQFNYTTNNGTITITGYTGPGGAVTIPSTIDGLPVTTIGDYAFSWCSDLTSVTIPNSVTTIGESAFASCISLTSVTIPNSITNIGVGPFAGCSGLSAITADTLNAFYSSVDGILFNKKQTELTQYPAGKTASDYTIPNSVTNIGDYAFYDCSGLTSVTIPNSVATIGGVAFSHCSGLTSVTIGNSVTTIGHGAFMDCSSLTSITIPNSVTSFVDGYEYWDGEGHPQANGVFSGCTSLTNVTIPSSVTTIGDYAFSSCYSLTSVFFRGNAPALGFHVFEANATVYYLPGSSGWRPTFGGFPTALWYLPNPLILDFGASFGVQTNRFGFIISWATNASVVVEASTNLSSHVWSPVATNTLTGGSSYFSDPQWTNSPTRFYRLRSP